MANQVSGIDTSWAGDEAERLAGEYLFTVWPHRDPGPKAPAWKREIGERRILIEPGRETFMEAGVAKPAVCPHGPLPRLLLAWMAREVLRAGAGGDCRLELKGLGSFLAGIGVDPRSGRSGALRRQIEGLFAAILYVSGRGLIPLRMVVVSRYDYLSHRDDPERELLWGSTITLSDEFHDILASEAAPQKARVLKAIKNDTLALDLYAILNREAFRARKEGGEPGFVSFERLHRLIGDEFGGPAVFRRKVRPRLDAIQAADAGLAVRPRRGQPGRPSGLLVSPEP